MGPFSHLVIYVNFEVIFFYIFLYNSWIKHVTEIYNMARESPKPSQYSILSSLLSKGIRRQLKCCMKGGRILCPHPVVNQFSLALWTFEFEFSNIFYDNILNDLYMLHLNLWLIPDHFSPTSDPASVMDYLERKLIRFQGLIWCINHFWVLLGWRDIVKNVKNSNFFYKITKGTNW